MRTDDCILNIDGYSWAFALRSVPKRDDVVQAYVAEVTKLVEEHRGKVWNVIGDCVIASHFPNVDFGVNAALGIQAAMLHLNELWRTDKELRTPLVIRIGVSHGKAPDVRQARRGEFSSASLDRAGHLQKHCPPGRILIEKSVFERLSLFSPSFRPGPFLSKDQLETYLSKERSKIPEEIAPRDRLAQKQRKYFPLMPFPSSHLLLDASAPSLLEIRDVLDDGLVILGETNRPGMTPEDSAVYAGAATSDAAGAIEMLSSLRSAPSRACGMDEWVETEDQAFRSNILLLGSPAVNIYAYALNSVLSPQAEVPGPVGFWFEDFGLMRIKVKGPRGDIIAFPQRVDHSGRSRHYGLALVCRSPFDPEKRVAWVAGISGMATYAVSRFLHDMIADPTGTLNNKLAPDCPIEGHPNVAIVSPDPGIKWQINDYVTGGWRVSDYKIAWLGRVPAL